MTSLHENDTDNQSNAINQAVKLPSLNESDTDIQSNAILQVLVCLGMAILYLFVRRRAPWVYYPNIKNKPLHPCYQDSPGLFSWIYPMVSTKDTSLLSMIGLDGFMFLQTIKLLYRICFILSVLIVPPLCGWFYFDKTPSQKAHLFIALSIWQVHDPRVFWFILALSYIATLLIFYLVFIYYKRYVTLRQLYLAAPATMTSISDLKKMSMELHGDQNAIDYVNVSAKTVLIDRLPPSIENDEGLLAYLETLKLGDIESVSLIHDTYALQRMYEERNGIIQDIEKEVAMAVARASDYYATEACAESFGDLYTSVKSGSRASGTLAIFSQSNYSSGGVKSSSLAGGPLASDTLAIFSQSHFKTPEKVSLFNDWCKYGESFFSKTWLGQSIVDFHIARLHEVHGRILREKIAIHRPPHHTVDIPVAADGLFVDSDVRSDVSFFSLAQIANFWENSEYFTLDLPFRKKKAFVTFCDQRTAGIIRQTKLGSRAFSSNISPAPAPKDVMWRTIARDEVAGFFFKILSLGIYGLFIFAFLYLVVIIIRTLDYENNRLNWFFRIFRGNDRAIGIYQSILVPLVYNILLYFVPIIIKALIHMEDIHSFSDVQVRLMYKFSLFLFFNAFIATFVTSCFAQQTPMQFLATASSADQDSVAAASAAAATAATATAATATSISAMPAMPAMAALPSSVIKASVFFFNTIVQRMCVGAGIVFLKPSPFLYNFFLARHVIYTRRQQQERAFTPPIDFGNHIPNLLLILPMALVYSCICPLLLVISWLFYFSSYFLYKNELLFATRNDFESGGAYWKPTVSYIFYSVITFQAVTALLSFSYGFGLISCLFIPLIFLTVIFSEGMNVIFNRSCENFPLNAPEERFLDRFARKALVERHNLLKNWKETGIQVDEDVLPITELGLKEGVASSTKSFYKDPALLTSIGNIILPANFFKIVHYLKSFDQKNLFGLKKQIKS